MCNKSRLECLFLEWKLEIVYLLSSRRGSEDANMSIAPAVKPSRYQHIIIVAKALVVRSYTANQPLLVDQSD